jgi:ferredoxin-NADP reductase
VESVTHDVKRFTIQKPEGFKFIPGQATEVSINTPALKNEKRPFTFTSLNNEQLEFTIKIMIVTTELQRIKLKHGDELIIQMFGAQLNIKAKEYSLLVVQVLHLSQYFGS